MQLEEQSYTQSLQFIGLCALEYEEGRYLQDSFVEQRKRNEIPDTFILCEHPPIITLGKRSSKTAENEIYGIRLLQTDRGGLYTYHGPGQLVVYPVFDLALRGIGVKRFIAQGLSILADVCQLFGVRAEARLDKPGLWVEENKIGSVGLKIERGITNHGFSLNVSCDLRPFAFFSPCGDSPGKVTSISQELGCEVSLPDVLQAFQKCAKRAFNSH